MPEITIRNALPSDVKTILNFIQELADYEKEPEAVKATEEDIRCSLFSERANVFGLICESENNPIGFAVYFFNYSTWLGKNGLFLEDLYVTPDSRGLGAGKALMTHLAKMAVEKNCGRFEWNCLDWNQPSRDFYHSLGAEPLTEWITYRLTGQALVDLANNS